MQVVQEQLAVAADPAEVGRARRWVRVRLLDLGADPTAGYAETLVLLVSELVTNAVVHAGSPAVLRLVWPRDEGPVRVEVADACGAAPQPRHACPGRPAGAGSNWSTCSRPAGAGARRAAGSWSGARWSGPARPTARHCGPARPTARRRAKPAP